MAQKDNAQTSVLTEMERDLSAQLAAVRQEIGDLEKRADSLAARVNAVRLLLHGSAPQEGEPGPERESMGFRESIRSTLKNAKRPMSVTEVAEALVSSGIQLKDDAATDMPTRVANELSRLLRKQQVRRIGRGMYSAK
ncbi:MAG TPA: hypothetical protein VJ724_05460 [Tahibacter sp.]|nr:hypothetical protein [Tahibacter sp.]